MIYVIYVENLVTAFLTFPTSSFFNRIHPSGRQLEWLFLPAVNTHLPIKYKVFPFRFALQLKAK